MIILTKKYRLIWNPETKEILGFPMEEHVGSKTIVGKGMLSFETDSIEELNNKVEELNAEM